MPNINEQLLYDMFNDGIYNIEIGRYGEATAVEYDSEYTDYDSFIEYFEGYYDRGDDIVTASVFNATQQWLESLIYNAKYYKTGRDLMLQLHDNHTAYDIDNENITETAWEAELEAAIYHFENETGVEVFTEGRSGRHICVALTLENLERYDELVATALKYEREFIDQLNSVASEED